ncbi:MAG: polyprenyl synthetase family protein [Verrucomicrobia bacterium]|nr:polyprenyl synthetase family protein [Verrucomicrobiota bacterium]
MLATDADATRSKPPDRVRDELKQFWDHLSAPLRPFLCEVSEDMSRQVDAFEPEVAEFARYALENQGKQLRPLLVGLSAQATGGTQIAHIRIAVIIEMIHLATLVHDDIMDHADVRRSKPTLANRWGNEIAVMLGDCLFAHALKLASDFPTVHVCRFVSESTRTVCSGEIIQNFRKNHIDGARERYFKVIAMKTAELFGLACDQGAYHNQAPDSVRTSLRQFGIHFGTAYQIFDDLLDLFGNEDEAGKSLGTDLETGKLTLPIIHILESSQNRDSSAVLKEIHQNCQNGPQYLHQLAREFHTVAHCRNALENQLNLAKSALNQIPHPATELHGLIDFIVRLTETNFPK